MNRHPIRCAVIVLLVAVLFATPAITISHTKEIEPADVYVETLLVRAELELIRQALQKPLDSRPALRVRDAEPREVYFQAASLLLKANRLCYQLSRPNAGARIVAEIKPPNDLRPEDVWHLMHRTWVRLQCAKIDLKLNAPAKVVQRDPSKTPTDVFKSIVQANRQLNLLLERRLSPAEVFALVKLANDTAVAMLDKLAPVWRVSEPTLPTYAESKQPVDVYQKLFKSYQLIQQIAEISDLSVLDLEPDIDPSIIPSDVFDMASLVLSELRYFATLIDVDVPYRLRFQHKKVPSDVFQRAHLLELQLHAFHLIVKSYPGWHQLEQ